MRKRIVLGDMHGHYKTIEDIYAKEQPDDVIILGDYFDSFGVDHVDQIKAYNSLIELKNNHKDGSFELLLGNHDYHYIVDIERYSGYSNFIKENMQDKLVEDYKSGVIKICKIDEINKTIYSHAGVTNTWMSTECGDGCKISDINNISLDALKFTFKGSGDCYGNTVYSSPIWVRPTSLCDDAYVNSENVVYNQIVGHTHYRYPKIIENGNAKLYFLDTMPSYYITEKLDDELKLVSREITENTLH